MSPSYRLLFCIYFVFYFKTHPWLFRVVFQHFWREQAMLDQILIEINRFQLEKGKLKEQKPKSSIYKENSRVISQLGSVKITYLFFPWTLIWTDWRFCLDRSVVVKLYLNKIYISTRNLDLRIKTILNLLSTIDDYWPWVY